jgi:hypothetical protein
MVQGSAGTTLLFQSLTKYRAVPVFIVKNLLRSSGMSREKYFELLEMC